jgi:hypothetical protein
MSIVCKWSVLGNQTQATFNTIQEMVSHEMYNNFTYICMNKNGFTEMPEHLPNNLQILRFNDNKIFKLPKLPPVLHSLVGENNRISEFPDISHCFLLEDIDLSGNDIVELNKQIPSNVKTINVDFNRLRSIRYELIDPSIKVSAAYNFLNEVPPRTHIENVKFDHNDISDKQYRLVEGDFQRLTPAQFRQGNNADNADNAVVPYNRGNNYALFGPPRYDTIRPYVKVPERIAGTDSQSVHNTSIQKSADKSLTYVLEYVSKQPAPTNFVGIIEAAYYNNKIKKSIIRRGIKCLSLSLAKKAIFPPPIRKWCDANDIHSQFGVTYKTLLKKVWEIIQDHEHRLTMEDVLFQEMDDSKYVCFTGRFTRTLNALTGFIGQVQIGINSKEQMGNQIAMVIKRTKEKLGDDYIVEARQEVKKILVEFEVPEVEHEVWLDAIE